jgi:hypothetical protein
MALENVDTANGSIFNFFDHLDHHDPPGKKPFFLLREIALLNKV